MILRKKLRRDIWENKGGFLALCTITAMALCVFIGMNLTMRSLNTAIQSYYEDYRFADVFATVQGIPVKESGRLTEIPGIAQVTSRLVQEERVLFPDSQDNIYLRLISYDPEDTKALNQAHLFSGQPLEQAEKGIYINPGFAEAHGLEEGGQVPVLIDGQIHNLTVLGVAQSPEYIYAVSGSGDIFPNPAAFGVAMAPIDLLDQLYQRQGWANSLAFRLEEGANYAEVEILLRDRLNPYRLQELTPREDQVSHFMLETEVAAMQTMGKAIPLLLLSIAAVVMLISLKRRVEQQRGQIGILLAFGYTRREIILHYLAYGLWVGLVGGCLGLLLGVGMLNIYIAVFQDFFVLPDFTAKLHPSYLILAPMLSIAFSLGACLLACRDLLKLQPVEAMRPPAPKQGRRIWWEKIPQFWNMFTTSGKMALRNMVRAPFRSFVSLGGVGLVFAMMAVVFSFNNLLQVMISDQYEKVEVYDVKVGFRNYQDDESVRRELSRYPGITLVETMVEAPCTLRKDNLSLETVALGLAEDCSLYNVLDAKGQNLELKANQVILAKTLGDQLGVSSGDIIYFDSPLLDEAKPLIITEIIPQYVGANLYLNQETLWTLAGKGSPVTSAMIMAPPEIVNAFREDYRLSSQIASISRADDTFAMVSDYLGAYMAMIVMMGLAVGFVGFVIVYNSALISFSERSRELASLLVLGLNSQETTQVVSFEQWFLGCWGMLLGIPCAIVINKVLCAILNNELYAIPESMPLGALLGAAGTTAFYLFLAQRRIARKIKRLNIVDVLKERD